MSPCRSAVSLGFRRSPWGDEVALGHGDAAEDGAGAVLLGVEVEAFDNLLDGGFAVVVVVDGEGVDVAEFFGLGTEDAGKDGVEGAHPDVLGFAAHELHDTFLHLGGSLVGEGEGEDGEGSTPSSMRWAIR